MTLVHRSSALGLSQAVSGTPSPVVAQLEVRPSAVVNATEHVNSSVKPGSWMRLQFALDMDIFLPEQISGCSPALVVLSLGVDPKTVKFAGSRMFT